MVLKSNNNPKTENKFCIYNDTANLPWSSTAAYIGEGFVGICTAGSAVIEVFSTHSRIISNDLVVIFPLQLVSIRDRSEDFSMTFFKVGKDMFLDIMSGLYRMTPDFFYYMRKNFRFHLGEEDKQRFFQFFNFIELRAGDEDPAFKRETIMHLLRVFYWDLYVDYKKNPDNQKSFRFSHKENIAFKFELLVIEHHKQFREVAFYADKLCISPKYLTMIMLEVSGQSARDCIAEYIVLEMKALLRNADLEIKDVVRQTGFPNQSTLSSFFRRQTGMSPSEYRASIHIL